jgi:hypothetical protein
MFTNMLRKRMESQVHLHEAQAAFRARSCTDNLFVLTHPQEAGKANKTVFASWTCAKRMIGLEGWAVHKLLERCGWKVGGSCET